MRSLALATAFLLALLPLQAQIKIQMKGVSIGQDERFQSTKRPRAVALIGDRYHSPVHIRKGLSLAFRDENIPIVYTENVKAIDAESLREFQLLVIFRDGADWPNGYDKPYVQWMTPEQQRAIADFVRAGGGFLPLHNAEALYPKDGPYRELVGGVFLGHPPPAVYTIRVENKNHPVTQGVEDYEIFDEQHMIEYDADRVQLLLRSISRDNKESAAGWAYEYGKGRVCYLAIGHTPEGLEHPSTQRLIRNAIRWCLRLE